MQAAGSTARPRGTACCANELSLCKDLLVCHLDSHCSLPHFSQDKLTQLHEEEHRRLDGEISAMNAEMAALSLEDKPDVTETTPPNPSTETSVDQLTSEPMDGHDQPLPSTSNDLSPPTAGTDQTGADMSMGHPKTSPAVTTTYVDKPTGDCDGEEDTN